MTASTAQMSYAELDKLTRTFRWVRSRAYPAGGTTRTNHFVPEVADELGLLAGGFAKRAPRDMRGKHDISGSAHQGPGCERLFRFYAQTLDLEEARAAGGHVLCT